MASYNKTNKVNKECLVCKKEFITTEYLLSKNKGKYCSKKCCDLDKIGKISKRRGFGYEERICLYCNNKFLYLISCGYGKYCSKECSNKSKIGKKLSEETKIKLKQKARRGINHHFFGRKNNRELNPRWIKDRTLLKDDHKDRWGQLHKEWSNSVKKRDDWKCQIADNKCNGKLEAHHILGWKDNPELRYDINNGISLCHAHHPRKRAEEKRLESYFMNIVSVSK